MSGINTSGYSDYSAKPVKQTRSYEKATEKKAENSVSEETKKTEKRTDTFERSDRSAAKGVSAGYGKTNVRTIKNEGMKDTIAALLGQAANGSKKNGSIGIDIESVLRSYGVEPIESDGSEDFWGAEKTANRILDFAKSLAGNNKEAFEKVKGAFTTAFGECEKIWGSKLPDVCYDTLSRVQQGFDEWENELNGASASAE